MALARFGSAITAVSSALITSSIAPADRPPASSAANVAIKSRRRRIYLDCHRSRGRTVVGLWTSIYPELFSLQHTGEFPSAQSDKD